MRRSLRLLDPLRSAVLAAGAVAVGLVLGPSTPGPVLGAGWRLAAAVVVGFLGLALAHRMLQRGPDRSGLAVAGSALTVVLVATLVVSQLLAVITPGVASEQPAALSAALAVDRPIQLAAAVLLAGLVAAALSQRTPVPGPLLFLGAGVLLGPGLLGVLSLDDPGLAQGIGVAALVVILFDGGLGTTRRELRQAGAPGVALATVGVGVTAGVTALGAVWLLGVEARTAWLLGAIVASTDAAAVFSLLRSVRVPGRLGALLRVESGGNDPVAVLLTVGLLAAWDAPATATAWLGFGALQVLGGLAMGVVVGRVGAELLRRIEFGTGGLYPVLALAIALAAYGAAVAVGGSGFLATFVAGVVVSDNATRRRTTVRAFVDVLSSGVEVVLFLLLGVLVDPLELLAVAPQALAVTAVLLLVARPLACLLSLSWFRVPVREQTAVAWLGLRGAAPIVLATFALTADVPGAGLLFDVVFFAVLASVLLQGVTAPALLRRLALDDGPPAYADQPEVVPLDDVDLDVVELAVPAASPLLLGPLSAHPPPDDILVTGVDRAGRVLLPRGGTRLQAGDRLVVTTSDRRDGLARVVAWVRDPASVPVDRGPAAPHARQDGQDGARNRSD